MAVKRHYHVTYNTAGYLPEHDTETYATLRDAQSAMRWWRDTLLDDIAERADLLAESGETEQLTGSVTSGCMVLRSSDPYRLDRILAISACDYPECLDDLED